MEITHAGDNYKISCQRVIVGERGMEGSRTVVAVQDASQITEVDGQVSRCTSACRTIGQPSFQFEKSIPQSLTEIISADCKIRLVTKIRAQSPSSHLRRLFPFPINMTVCQQRSRYHEHKGSIIPLPVFGIPNRPPAPERPPPLPPVAAPLPGSTADSGAFTAGTGAGAGAAGGAGGGGGGGGGGAAIGGGAITGATTGAAATAAGEAGLKAEKRPARGLAAGGAGAGADAGGAAGAAGGSAGGGAAAGGGPAGGGPAAAAAPGAVGAERSLVSNDGSHSRLALPYLRPERHYRVALRVYRRCSELWRWDFSSLWRLRLMWEFLVCVVGAVWPQKTRKRPRPLRKGMWRYA